MKTIPVFIQNYDLKKYFMLLTRCFLLILSNFNHFILIRHAKIKLTLKVLLYWKLKGRLRFVKLPV